MLPKKLKILGRTFLVKAEKLPSCEEEAVGKCEVADKYVQGMCDVIDQYILISPDMHAEQQASVLLHEWLEAVNQIMGLHLAHHKIDALEVALYDLLVANKIWVNSDTAAR